MFYISHNKKEHDIIRMNNIEILCMDDKHDISC